VVRPEGTGAVAALLRWASERQVPVTPWGLGSSVTGAPLALHGGVLLDLSGMSGLLAMGEIDLTVTAAAGTRAGELEKALNERGYSLNNSPQSLDRSTVGGWIATRETGQFSSRYGGIEDLVVTFTVVLADGTVVRLPDHPRAAIGPDLRHLFMGAEGTTGVVTEVTMRIFPLPDRLLLETIRFDRLDQGLTAMRLIMRAGLRPFLIRLYDQEEARHALGDPGFTGAAMFLGSEGPIAAAAQERALQICAGGQRVGPGPAEAWMQRRYDFSTIENLLAEPGGYAETIEVAHYWSRIGELHARAKEALAPLADEVLGHFSHAYPQGTSLYLILLGRAGDDAEAERRIDAIWRAAMEVTVATGGALSHHHGVGIARLPWIRAALGDSAGVLDRVKAALDPAGVLNPGKLGLVPPPPKVR
jgi:alkyldihydroxyacetonephosphate synthase